MALKNIGFGVLLGFCLAGTAYAADVPVPVDRIVAVVNDTAITESALDTRLQQVRQQLVAQHINPPPASDLRSQVLNRMILDRLQLDYAKRAGITVSPAQIDQAEAELAERNHMTLPQFQAALVKDGIDARQFRAQLHTSLVIRALVQREIQPQVEVTDREVADYLAKEKALGEVEYHLRDLFVPVTAGRGLEKARAEVQQLAAQLKAGASFSELAIQYSQGPEALAGGDLGWKKAAELPPALLSAVQDLPPGGVSAPVQTPDGFHLLKLLGRQTQSRPQVVSQMKVRHILIKPNAIVSLAEAQARAQQLRAQIKQGAHFSEIARKDSDDTLSASVGGDLGWVDPGQLAPPVEAAANKLAPGQLSEPIVTSYGVELIQVLARRQRDISGELDEAQARRELQERKASELYEKWLHDLRERAYVHLLTRDQAAS